MVAGGIGTYYALDAAEIRDDLTPMGEHTGEAWTQELENRRKDGASSSKIAAVGLGIGGAFAVASIVAFIVTAPDDTVGYQEVGGTPTIIPTHGGWIAGQTWSF